MCMYVIWNILKYYEHIMKHDYHDYIGQIWNWYKVNRYLECKIHLVKSWYIAWITIFIVRHVNTVADENIWTPFIYIYYLCYIKHLKFQNVSYNTRSIFKEGFYKSSNTFMSKSIYIYYIHYIKEKSTISHIFYLFYSRVVLRFSTLLINPILPKLSIYLFFHPLQIVKISLVIIL